MEVSVYFAALRLKVTLAMLAQGLRPGLNYIAPSLFASRAYGTKAFGNGRSLAIPNC